MLINQQVGSLSGQKLAFRCQDTSDASYCRNGGTFDTSLAKYRKDSYKAKAFIHQVENSKLSVLSDFSSSLSFMYFILPRNCSSA